MKLIFKPIRSDAKLSVAVEKDTLIVNETRFDFGSLADGQNLPLESLDTEVFADDVVRENDQLVVSLFHPYGAGQESGPDIICTPTSDGPVDPTIFLS